MKAYIALGSNLEQPLLQIKKAIEYISNHSDLHIIKTSSCYQSKALLLRGRVLPGTLPGLILDNKPQPDYINAVLLLETQLAAKDLLIVLQKIENKQGRIRSQKWSARTLDLDILLYDDIIIHTEHLIIPHPEMHLRNFVLYPLAEISPNIKIPGQGTLNHLLKNISNEGLVIQDSRGDKHNGASTTE